MSFGVSVRWRLTEGDGKGVPELATPLHCWRWAQGADFHARRRQGEHHSAVGATCRPSRYEPPANTACCANPTSHVAPSALQS